MNSSRTPHNKSQKDQTTVPPNGPHTNPRAQKSARPRLRQRQDTTAPVPFSKRPLVIKFKSFWREYAQELPRNRLLYVPFLPLVILLLFASAVMIFRHSPLQGADIYASVAAIELIAVLLPCTLWLRRFPRLSDDMGWRLPTPEKSACLLLLLPTLFFGAAALSSLGAYFGLSTVRYTLYTTYAIPATTSMAGILFSVVTFAIIPAFVEEILFRGILFAEYRQENPLLAVFMSAVFYALMHVDPSRLLLHLFVGILLGGARLFLGSLPAVIAVRCLYNVGCLFYEHFFGIMGNQFSEFLILFFICTVVFLLFVFFLCGELERIFQKHAAAKTDISPDFSLQAELSVKDALRIAAISPTAYFVLIVSVICSFIL